MTRIRNTLLITAILIFSVGAAVWGTRDAVAFTMRADVVVSPLPLRPAPTPDSGEPDTGSTKTQCQQRAAMRPEREDDQTSPVWGGRLVYWISRIWMARYLRTGL
jgi:hypothetical protein